MVESTPNFTGLIVRRQRIMGLWFGLLILVFGVIIGAGGTFLHFKDRLIQNRGSRRSRPQTTSSRTCRRSCP